jgi:hypothetical protein
MLGQFFYSPHIPDDGVVVEMQWRGRDAVGLLHIPSSVSEVTAGTDYEEIETGETATLIIALGLGLILAGLAGTHLVISGERSIWEESWGALLEMPSAVDEQ